jgi:ABC-type sugar transport system ATPase subunit
LRNGQHVITAKNGEIDHIEVVKHMLGRDITAQYPVVKNNAQNENCLEVQDLADHSGKTTGVSFVVKKGEVLGIYGLLGSGRTEILEDIFGLYRRQNGTILLDGKPAKKQIPSVMIGNGVVLIPEDRRKKSIIRDYMTLEQNTTLGSFKKFSNAIGLINRTKEVAVFENIVYNPGLRVKFVNKNQNIGNLSGGNQQKVVLGRWIFRDNLKLVMLDEPTQGIDVGVKHDIYVIIRELTKKGISVLMVSSELLELISVCDRIIVLRDGKVKDEFKHEEFDGEKILGSVL